MNAKKLNQEALLSEAALAEDWNRPEEDAAWAYLQEGRRSYSSFLPIQNQIIASGFITPTARCSRSIRTDQTLPS